MKRTYIIIALLAGVLILILLLLTSQTIKQGNLAPAERNYPEAAKQNYPEISSANTGILIVSTKPTAARVLIDAPEGEVANFPVPTNITPFKNTAIPEGSHKVSIFKDGYEEFNQTIQINKDQITRLDIELTPLHEPDPIVKYLPLEGDYWYLEYLPDQQIIKATLTPPPAVEVTKEEQISFLKKEILYKLELRGIKITEEDITWEIK